MDNFGNVPMPTDLDEGEYHVSQAGLHYGPFRLAELLARALTSDMLIWKPGMPDWRPIEEVTELIPYVRRVAAITLAIPPALPVPQAIAVPVPPPMPLAERSALVTAMAVLNCTFGALGVLCGTPIGVAMVAMPAPGPFLAIMGNPVVQFVQFFGLGIGFVNSVIVAASGVGLWKQRAWGGRFAIYYGVLSIVTSLVIAGLLGVLTVAPMFVVARQHNTPEVWDGAFGGLGGVVGGACAGLVYPVIVLAVMRNQASTRCLQ
jgi:hypothetical protein